MAIDLTETGILASLAASRIPDHMHGGLMRYLVHGIQPGSFMLAVLSNDLQEACMRADDSNRYRLFDYVSWLYSYAPQGSWGSEDRVIEWMTHRRETASV